MKTEMKIAVRVFPVELKDTRIGERFSDTIVLEKSRIQAAALLDMGDEDIIYRIYNRQGYRVLEIGKPRKIELMVDLEDLLYRTTAEHCTEREVIDLTKVQEE